MKNFKTAVFGTGFMGRVHLEAIRRLGSFRSTPSASASGEGAAAGRPVRRREGGGGLSPDPGGPRGGRGAHLHAQRPALPHGHGCPGGRQARDLREAADHYGRGGPRTGGPGAPAPSCAIACSTTCATTPWCSRCAACAKPANWARSWWCRAPTRRTGCSTIPTGTGAWMPRTAARSRCLADIGTHWFDMAEHVTGLRVTSLCADLQTFHATRKRPKGPVETFAGKTLQARGYVEVPVATDDFGAVIFRMGERARGAMTASQVSAGCKNRLQHRDLRHEELASPGTRSGPTSYGWGIAMPPTRSSSRTRRCWGPRRARMPTFPAATAKATTTPSSRCSAASTHSFEEPAAAPEYPQFRDGLRQLQLVEAEFASHDRRGWVDVPALHAATA